MLQFVIGAVIGFLLGQYINVRGILSKVRRAVRSVATKFSDRHQVYTVDDEEEEYDVVRVIEARRVKPRRRIWE